jgi:hypothetical protein
MQEIGRVLGQVAADIRHTYTIGYVPANTVRDGRFRRTHVEVRAEGRDLRVRTRHGYVVEEP